MAKAASQNQFEQVTALYEERQRFEAWLAALEAKRATTPVHIYTRVHADYGTRLQRVVEELRTHRTALQELESTLIDRLTALDGEEAKHRDEAAEAELRATVGELASEHFTEVTERTSGAIARLSEERGRVQAELSQLRHLLDVGTAPLPVAAVGQEPARAEPYAPDTARLRLVDSGAPAPIPSHDAPPPPTPADWELSFENALGGNPAPAPPRHSGPRAAEKAPERAQEPNPFDDLEFLKTMVDRNTGEHTVVNPTRERPPEPAAPAPAPEPLETMPTAPPVKQRPSKPQPVAASGLPLIMPDAPAPPRTESRFPQGGARDSVPSYLKESPPEQVKTLKCQECGTLNYPTEWYCERCGAELAAL
jgi:Skp family chaperone for outer membrane proteins